MAASCTRQFHEHFQEHTSLHSITLCKMQSQITNYHGYGDQDYYGEGGYEGYDDGYGGYGYPSAVVGYIPPPDGHIVDAEGRLLKGAEALIDPEFQPEDVNLFISKFQAITRSSAADWSWTAKIVWPEFLGKGKFRKLDLYERQLPHLQIATFNPEDSVDVRRTQSWYPVRTIFFVDQSGDMTFELLLESSGPPRRSKFRPKDKQNNRDLSKWLSVDSVNAYHGPTAAQGSCQFYVDYADLPDRYFLSSEDLPALGHRRTYRFAAYSATQYYILEKRVVHETLNAEGGSGVTYYIESGPIAYARKDWRLIGSFYGFDHQLPGTSLVTVYRRMDPFPRMLMALQPIQNAHEWDNSLQFYAFDVPAPNTAKYNLQHCLRSIYSMEASVPRHRLTTEDPRLPWEFRMTLYCIPATLNDCTVLPYNPHKDDEY